jgi:uncharacterized protein (TIGR02996 family)
MHTDADFLTSILAAPERDDLRLVYADFLEERGDGDRAAFIVSQIRVENYCAAKPEDCDHHPDRRHAPTLCPSCRWEIACDDLLNRPFRLLVANKDRWLPSLRPRVPWVMAATWAIPGLIVGHRMSYTGPHDPTQLTFRRGFVSSVTLTAADWLHHADALTAVCPLESVTLTTWPEVVIERVSDLRARARWAFAEWWFSIMPDRTDREATLVMLRESWPRITFTPPP